MARLSPVWGVCAVNLTITVLGLGIAILQDSAEGFRRTGAALCAITALFVIWQVMEEMRMERQLHEEAATKAPEPDNALPPLERTAARLVRTRQERHERELHRARLRLVGIIALWIFLGELLHGYGDLLYEFGARFVA